MAALHPKVTISAAGVAAASLVDGKPETEIVLPKPTADSPQFVQLQFDKPLEVRTIGITPGKGMGDCGGEIQVSDDGATFNAIRTFSFQRKLSRPIYVSLDKPAKSAWFRVVFNKSGDRTTRVPLAEIDLTPRMMIDNVQPKAGYVVGFDFSQSDNTSPDLAVQRDSLVDLTSQIGRRRQAHLGRPRRGLDDPAHRLHTDRRDKSPSAARRHWAGMRQVQH